MTFAFACPLCTYFTEFFHRILPSINLDFLRMMSFDCITDLNLYLRFIITISTPVTVVILVQLVARRLCRNSGDKYKDGTTADGSGSAMANQISLVITFLVYPTLMTTIFTMFACRDLDFEQRYHIYDTSIDCNLGTHTMFELVAIVLLVLLPVGIPAFFGYLLFRAREALRDGGTAEFSFDDFSKLLEKLDPDYFTQNFKSVGGRATLREMFDDIDVDQSDSVNSEELMRYYNYKVGVTSAPRERINLGITGAEEKRAQLSFLVKSFKPQHYYFELVSYSKKFV